MFLKKLTISNDDLIIRDIPFHRGINLIIDETRTEDKTESGNNVGKTTVLRLIDFCLGGKGKNIYEDSEFKGHTNTAVEKFLTDNNIIIELILKADLEINNSNEIVIRRNFLKYSDKIQEINGEKYSNDDFPRKLKELVFNSKEEKPNFRQIIAKNIRDEKNRLVNTLKVLSPYTSADEYEALFLFWLGIDLDFSSRKQKLLQQKKAEEKIQTRLKKENSLPQINQFLIVSERTIKELEIQKNSFNLNDNYDKDLTRLNLIKSKLNTLSTRLGSLEVRRDLIIESKEDLEKDLAEIDIDKVRNLYKEAHSLIPNLQKSFEETIEFHNQMIAEKLKFITQEIPALEENINSTKREITSLLLEEKSTSQKLLKTGAIEELQKVITELNIAYEKKGMLEEQKRFWESSNEKIKLIDEELNTINKGIASKDELIQNRIATFNKFFTAISEKLYKEQFVLSPEINDKGYSLIISSFSGNLGTGKKKGQIAAFDLAYIQFADFLDIDCLHFILHDQIENVHENQITNLLNEIVSNVNCQYVLPVLRGKLPDDIDVTQFEVLSLSQSEKLFKI